MVHARWRPRTFGPALVSGAGHAAIILGLLLFAARPRMLGRASSVGALELHEAPSLEPVPPEAPPDTPGPEPSKPSAPLPVRQAARASAPVVDRPVGNNPGGTISLPSPDGEPSAEGIEADLGADAGVAPAGVGEDVLTRAAGGAGTGGGGQAPIRPPPPPPPIDRSRGPIPPPLDRALESQYPPDAQRRGVTGMASVRVLVRRDGTVGRVVRVSESSDSFGSACVEAMKVAGRWQAAFNAEGVPVDEEALVTCRFVQRRSTR